MRTVSSPLARVWAGTAAATSPRLNRTDSTLFIFMVSLL